MHLRGTADLGELNFDPEIERTTRRLRRQAQQERRQRGREMADGQEAERTLADYATVNPNTGSTSIVRPAVTAQNFEIKPAYIHLIQQEQFSGSPQEDPNDHIANFLSILDFFRIQGATDEAIRLRLFPLSLRDKAKSWLLSQPQGSITTWDDLARKFIDKHFPAARQTRLRQEINAFVQQEGESLHEAWERYRDLLRRCPTHSMPDWMQIRLFYDGLKMSNKSMIDAAASGSFESKTPTEARELIEKMAKNSSQASSERVIRKKGLLELDDVQSLLVQNKEMQQQIATLTKQMGKVQVGASVSAVTTSGPSESVMTCDFCGGNHPNGDCGFELASTGTEEQVNYVGGAPRNFPNNNNYYPGIRNHPNLSWHSPALQPPPQEKKQAPWELAMEKLAQ